MPNVTLVAGLPGSGKSRFLNERKVEYSGLCVHDFMKESCRNSPRFRDSQYYGCLIHDLRNGKDCIIADIEFCVTSKRQEAERTIRADVPDVIIEWIFFENHPGQCRENVRERARQSCCEELRKIDSLSPEYAIPPDARVLPIETPQ